MSPIAKAPSKEIVRAHRERRRAAGRVLVNTDLPAELVKAIDQLKEARGVRGRTPIIEEAETDEFATTKRTDVVTNA